MLLPIPKSTESKKLRRMFLFSLYLILQEAPIIKQINQLRIFRINIVLATYVCIPPCPTSVSADIRCEPGTGQELAGAASGRVSGWCLCDPPPVL